MAPAHSESHITELLTRHASTKAKIITYAHGESTKPVHLSYRQLHTLATRNAERLRGYKEIIPGSVILIHFQNHLENIIWFWSAVFADCVPCMSTPLVNNREGRLSQFKHLHRLLLDPVVITSQKLLSSDFAENNVLRTLAVEDIEERGTPPPPDTAYEAFTTGDPATGHHANNGIDEAAPSTKGLAALMLTSGSTGNAKAVCLTHQQIFASIRGKLTAMPLTDDSVLLNWIALDHVANLTEMHLAAMFSGHDQIHIEAAEVVADPLVFLRLISKHGVSRTFAPDFFLRKLLAALDARSAEDMQDIDLHRLLYITSGGEPNNIDTCSRLAEHLVKLGAPNKNMISPGFGMTETCAGAIYSRNCPTIDIETGRQFAALGTCVPGIEMRISPIAHNEFATTYTNEVSGEEGALELHGPIVFKKYFNNEEATRDAFTADGWFKTGDLATFDAAGNLQLVGRSKDVININGVKYLPHEIEGVIEQEMIPGVASSFVACFAHRSSSSGSEEIFIVYQHTYDALDVEARVESLNTINRTVMLFAGARPNVLPLEPGRLKKTTLGKLSRTKILNSWVGGQYKDQEVLNTLAIQLYRAAHFAEPRNETERTLLRVFLENLDLEPTEMSIDTPILDTGVSSVDLIRLKGVCEEALDIKEIPIITIMTHTTIRSLAEAVTQIRKASQYQEKYNPVVTLQPNGPKVPLWLIHPGIGEVLVFLNLVKYFPDRPIHSLRARGFNPGEKPFKDLADVLTTYYDALKKQQPHGPYAIAGYSYGSMLAFELSKLLEANGDTVQFLGSFNLPPHIKERMRLLDWTAGLLHIAHFCEIITEERSEELTDELRKLPHPEQIANLLAESDRQRCEELALNQESLMTWINVSWSLQEIGWEYDPSGSASHMDVFYCQPLKIVARTREEYRTKKLNHWADFMRNGVRFHEVDGEHYTMIGADHVPKFQLTLKKALAARGL